MLTRPRLLILQNRIQRLVCRDCLKDGLCTLSPLGECPIAMHLPALVDIVRSVHSDRLDDYVQKLRTDVCSVCRSGELQSTECDYRDQGRCVLDSMLLPIVTIIEDHLARQRTPRRSAPKRRW